jgi:hypothetical protein
MELLLYLLQCIYSLVLSPLLHRKSERVQIVVCVFDPLRVLTRGRIRSVRRAAPAS